MTEEKKTDQRLPCPHCGDVKACFHRPDEIVTEAYWNELREAEKRGERSK